MKSTFAEIQSLANSLAARIKIPHNQLPTFGSSVGDGTPCIEIGTDGTVYYVITERGSEYERWVPSNMDDLLYRIFQGVTWSMAIQYELKNRIERQDSRRMSFDEHARLMGLLNRDWQSRLQKHYKDILDKHPFDDHSRERVDYVLTLQSSGDEYEKAWQVACEKYPLPG